MAKKWTEDERRAGERISDFSGMRIVKPKEKAKKRYEYMEKPAKCPECGYARITNILYGLPIFSEELDAEMKAGRITLGGCCVTDDDPVWLCTNCKVVIYRKSEPG